MEEKENVIVEESTELLEESFEHSSITLKNAEYIEIFGNDEQRSEMFKDWAGYIGEIQNPDNTATNPFFKKPDGSGSLYSPLDEVLNNARPTLSKYGFGILQSPTAETGRVSVQTILVHKSGGIISFPVLTIPVSKNDAQGVIAAVTYARRGSLNPILATHGETDDDGNTAVQGKPTQPSNELKDIKTNIIKLANEMGGSSNAELMTLIKKVVPSGNTNLIKEASEAKKLYDDMGALRDKLKKESK